MPKCIVCWWSGTEAQDWRLSDYGMSQVLAQALAAVCSVTAPWKHQWTDLLYVCLCVYVVHTLGPWKRSLLAKGFLTLNKICNPIQCIHVDTGFTKLVKYSTDIVSPCHYFLWCNPWYSPRAANVCIHTGPMRSVPAPSSSKAMQRARLLLPSHSTQYQPRGAGLKCHWIAAHLWPVHKSNGERRISTGLRGSHGWNSAIESRSRVQVRSLVLFPCNLFPSELWVPWIWLHVDTFVKECREHFRWKRLYVK